MITYNSVTVIVRSVGERTTNKCIEYLKKQFNTDDIILMKNITPFTECIRQTMKKGIENNKKWTLVIDADIFLFNEKIPYFFNTSEKILENDKYAFCIMPSVYDNFLEYSRSAGVHLFCTKYLGISLKYINNDALRPESYIINQMSLSGYSSYRIYDTIGIHDFFQSYQNIVMKSVLHCKKHANAASFRELWSSKKTTDTTFFYLCEGAAISDKIKQHDMKVDAEYIYSIVKQYIPVFPPQPLLTSEEISNVLEQYKHIMTYEKKAVTVATPSIGIFQRIGLKLDSIVCKITQKQE